MQVRKDDWHQDHGSADREKGTDSAGTQEVNLRAGLWDLRDGRGQILSTLLHSHLAESSTIHRDGLQQEVQVCGRRPSSLGICGSEMVMRVQVGVSRGQ